MKKLFFLLVCLFAANNLFAQVYGENHQETESILYDSNRQSISFSRDYYDWQPLNYDMGVAIYGSRYRKATTKRNWGVFLTCVIAPASVFLIGAGIDGKCYGWSVIGGCFCAGSLCAGIPLWSKGRRELDWMMDDYAKRYGPKPYSAKLSAGPTNNGIGLAFNF